MFKLLSIYCHLLVACFSILTFSNGQVPFEYAAEGQNLIETGIRNYTIWNADMAQINCSTYSIKTPADIKILKNGREVDDYIGKDQDVYVKESTFQTDEMIEGNYTCRILFASDASKVVGKHKLLYTLELKLQINRPKTRPSLCTTSVGESGFEGEEVTLICHGRNRWNPGRNTAIDIRLSDDEIVQYMCENKNNNELNCDLSNFKILTSLEVQMTTIPTTESGESAFLCNSTPPRLLYWRVWGEHGDILDLDNYGSSLKVDTNITITQTAGETSLLISEAVPGGNGIYAVECFTYQTHTKAIIVRVAQENDESCRNIGSIITIAFLVIVILILAILLFIIYFKIKKDGLQKDDIKPVEPQRIPTLHNNVAYVSSDIEMTDNGGNDQDYTYIDQK